MRNWHGNLSPFGKWHTAGSRVFSPAFDISSLFASGEAGVWYDPSDLSTLFQDTAGTTPVTAAGQTVGLMLDKSQGAGYADGSFTGLGSEENSNPGGPFTTTTGYTAYRSATLSIVSGALRVSGTTETFPYAGIPFSTVVGKTYYVEGLSTSVSGSNIDVYLQKNDSPSGAVNAVFFGPDEPAGIKSGVFVATATTTYILAISVQLDNVVDWSYISVKELPGNHATQPTAAARPTYQTDGNLHWLEFDGVDDFMEVPLAATQNLQKFTVLIGLSFSDPSVFSIAFGGMQASTRYVYGTASHKGQALAQLRSSSTVPEGLRVAATSDVSLLMNVHYDGSSGKLYLRSDGIDVAETSKSGGGGTPDTTTLYIGALNREGVADLFSDLKVYGLVTLDRNLDASEVFSSEQYLAKKSGVTL